MNLSTLCGLSTRFFTIVLCLTGIGISHAQLTVTPTASLADGVDGFDVLRAARSITTTLIGGTTYALVASYWNHGV